MRILIATEHRSVVGGVEKYLQTVMPGLASRGHNLSLLYERPPAGEAETIEPAHMPMPLWCAAEWPQTDLLAEVAQWGPDVVYSHGLTSPQLEDALLRSYPTVLYAHNYYGTCISGRKCHKLPEPRACGRSFGPGCLVLYYPRRCGGLHPGTMWQMFRRQAQVHDRLQQYAAVLVASEHMLREYQCNGVSPEKTYLVPLPVTLTAPAATVPERSPYGAILFVGRLTDVKGVNYLIRAIPRAEQELGRPLKLTIAGDGPERPALQRLARAAGVNADFLGWVPGARTHELMRTAALLAVPSIWPEPFGLVGTEAGYLGLPSVAFAVGGVPQWLIDGYSGELAPGDPPTVAGLAQAIVRALDNPQHYASLCRGASDVAARFSLAAHLSLLEPALENQAQPVAV